MERKRITGGGHHWLPFCRSRIKAMKMTGGEVLGQKFVMPDGALCKVWIVNGLEYIEIEGSSFKYVADLVEDTSEEPFPMAQFALTAGESVSANKRSTIKDEEGYTDWKGNNGRVLTYFNGAPLRYRLDYPHNHMPASVDIRYKKKTFKTGTRKVLGAGVFVSDTGREYIIYATADPGADHITYFYAKKVVPDSPDEPDEQIGSYSPYTSNDFTHPNYLVIKTCPDPWFFSPDGKKASSTMIKPNPQMIRHGFVANVSFALVDGVFVVTDTGNTGGTYQYTAYPAIPVTLSSFTLIYGAVYHQRSIYDVYSAGGSYKGRVTNTYFRLGEGSVGVSESVWDGVQSSLLLGADYAADGTQKILTMDYRNRGRTYATIAVTGMIMDVEDVIDGGPAGYIYRAGIVSTNTVSNPQPDDTTSIVEEGQFPVTPITTSAHSESGTIAEWDYRINGVSAYAVTARGSSNSAYSIDESFSTAVHNSPTTGWSVVKYGKDINHSAVFHLDARDGTILAMEARSKRFDVNSSVNDNLTVSVEAESAQWFVAKGLAPREVQCSASSVDYSTYLYPMYYTADVSAWYRGVFYQTNDPLAITNGTARKQAYICHLLPDGEGKSLGAAAAANTKTGEWVYSVDLLRTRIMLVVIRASDGAQMFVFPPDVDLLPAQRIQSSFAKVNSDAVVVENKTPMLQMMKDSGPTARMQDIRLLT